MKILFKKNNNKVLRNNSSSSSNKTKQQQQKQKPEPVMLIKIGTIILCSPFEAYSRHNVWTRAAD
jgi:hypothetical protein